MNSGSVRTGNAGFTTSTLVPRPSIDTGVNDFNRVVRQLGDRLVHGVRERREQQRIAVGRRARDDLGADDAARAAAVVDDDLLAERGVRRALKNRAMMSLPPPAGNATMMRTGRVGKSCAPASQLYVKNDSAISARAAALKCILHIRDPFECRQIWRKSLGLSSDPCRDGGVMHDYFR